MLINCAGSNDSFDGVLEFHGPSRNSSLGPDMSPLTLLLEPVDANILHVKIGAPGRWEVPQKDIFINTGIGECTA